LPHTQETSGKTGDTNLLQGLGVVYQRNVTSAAMHEYIGDYMAVQVCSDRRFIQIQKLIGVFDPV
jgi:hypothetical protein